MTRGRQRAGDAEFRLLSALEPATSDRSKQQMWERLATDAPDSPHLLAPRIKSRVYVAGAIEDASFPDEMKARLEEALTTAGVDHTIETYQARHGWVFRDTPVYDAAASERHWQTLLALFDATKVTSTTSACAGQTSSVCASSSAGRPQITPSCAIERCVHVRPRLAYAGKPPRTPL